MEEDEGGAPTSGNSRHRSSRVEQRNSSATTPSGGSSGVDGRRVGLDGNGGLRSNGAASVAPGLDDDDMLGTAAGWD
jgi:hypothetical protein